MIRSNIAVRDKSVPFYEVVVVARKSLQLRQMPGRERRIYE